MDSRQVASASVVPRTPLYLFDKYYASEYLLKDETDTSSSFLQNYCEEDCMEYLLVHTVLDTSSDIDIELFDQAHHGAFSRTENTKDDDIKEETTKSKLHMEKINDAATESNTHSVKFANAGDDFSENNFPLFSDDVEPQGKIPNAENPNFRRIDTDSLILNRKKHVEFVKRPLQEPFNSNMAFLETSRVWCLFWILHSLNLLDNSSNATKEEKVVSDNNSNDFSWKRIPCESLLTINTKEILQNCLSCSVKTFTQSALDPRRGGYGGGPMQASHLASTFAAVAALLSEGSDESLASIDRQSIYDYLLQSRDAESGGYRMHEDGEVDMRGTYCAIATASMLHILTDELVKGIPEYILSCQTYEGGICGEFGQEAHGGYTYCGFATLAILGNADILNLDALLNWLVKRQMGLEGGFQGRTNKLVDSCYSYWLGGLFSLLREVFCQLSRPFPFNHNWFSPHHLQLYLLTCCQSYKGGFRDRPRSVPDWYHTCYSLSGLSMAQHSPSSSVTGYNTDSVVGPSSNLLIKTDFFYNVVSDKVQRAREYFQKISFIEKRSKIQGIEGKGVSRFHNRTDG